ncbi:uncharacterized protein E0L32_006501 [Thyridium curvatum]|uniref:Uncharacterized protein n=1 Tax=Thyridium curvatum TaxID=1093900 RepID=A0A507AQD7_9PEZI|nr:uncharacterized protein E0L32_006501 [Thyridium curvatum]TPX13075.1 hypothetical protein E0L32_006501 [Thyridium curvatum]
MFSRYLESAQHVYAHIYANMHTSYSSHLTMDEIQQLLSTYGPQLDLAYHLLLYAPFIASPFKHFFTTKRAKAAGTPYPPLLGHIVCSLVEVARFQYRQLTAWSRTTLIPTELDLALCIINLVCTFGIARRAPRGDARFMRPLFQAMALIRFIATAAGYASADPTWYHASVKSLNGFVWSRVLIDFFFAEKIFGEGYSVAYTAGMFFGLSLSTMEGRYPFSGLLGVPVMLGIMLGLMLFERSMSERITPKYVPGLLLGLDDTSG